MNNSIYLQLISLNKTYNNHFLKRYVKLVSFFKKRNFKKKKFFHHEHHIIPESFGGLDLKENLVFITPREHFILHWMLYKAFPNSSMTTTFFAMCSGFGKMDFKVTSKVYEKLMLEFIERQRGTQNRMVVEGNHRWQDKEKQSLTQQKLVAEGKHHWQDKEKARSRANKRVADGNHHFSGGEIQRKMIENGTHPIQIKKVCPHCNREFNLGNFAKYHGDKCKLNPLYKDERKPKPKIKCEHCNKEFDLSYFTKYHGDKCRLNPLLEKNKVKKLCPHCNKEFDGGNYNQWHGDKCKLKPE